MAYTMQWRQLNTGTSLITVKKMDFIEQEDFIQQMLEKSILAYVCYLIIIESYLSQVHLFWMAQILATIAKPVTLPAQ